MKNAAILIWALISVLAISCQKKSDEEIPTQDTTIAFYDTHRTNPAIKGPSVQDIKELENIDFQTTEGMLIFRDKVLDPVYGLLFQQKYGSVAAYIPIMENARKQFESYPDERRYKDVLMNLNAFLTSYANENWSIIGTHHRNLYKSTNAALGKITKKSYSVKPVPKDN